jgi:exodeoxyribonuclease III
MKITTWNVNGFRAAMRNGAANWLVDYRPDILCLQEVKAMHEQVEDQVLLENGYSTFWNSARRPGYSGVACYYRNPSLQLKRGKTPEDEDEEGRTIRVEWDNWVLFNIYFPNGQRGQERVDFKLDFYEKLLEEIEIIRKTGKHVIITGDFNTAHREIDLANPRENSNTSGFLPIEREMIDKYLSRELVDVFRHHYPERVAYTWWTYRFNARTRGIGWRLDYYLMDREAIVHAKDVIVHDDVLGSDHCPVTLILE